MSHDPSFPGSLAQSEGETTVSYNFPGIPGSGNDINARVILKYVATEDDSSN